MFQGLVSTSLLAANVSCSQKFCSSLFTCGVLDTSFHHIMKRDVDLRKISMHVVLSSGTTIFQKMLSVRRMYLRRLPYPR